MESQTNNLMDGLLSEMDRVREIIDVYKEFPAGAFAISVMEASISKAKTSISTGDVILMLQAYEDLKGYTL